MRNRWPTLTSFSPMTNLDCCFLASLHRVQFSSYAAYLANLPTFLFASRLMIQKH